MNNTPSLPSNGSILYCYVIVQNTDHFIGPLPPPSLCVSFHACVSRPGTLSEVQRVLYELPDGWGPVHRLQKRLQVCWMHKEIKEID